MSRSLLGTLVLCVVAAFVSVEPAAAQQATFRTMGPVKGSPRESVPYDIREDGRVVVGFEYRRGPVRWKSDDWFEGLPTKKFGASGNAHGISADGRVIVGGWNYRPFRWTPQEGLVTLGDVGGSALDVSADGSIVVGSRGTGVDHAFRWNADDGFLDLETFGGVDGISRANAVSDDGKCIVGRSMTPAGNYRAFRWTKNEGLRGLGSLSDGPSVANGVSYDGRVVVGQTSAHGRRAFAWTAKSGMQLLPSLQRPTTTAMDVSDDGNVIVGQAESPFGDAGCIWTDGEPRYLSDLLQNEYGIDLTGWFILREITACSGDGTKLVGSGHFGLWRIGFVATIPPPPKMTTEIEPAGIHRAVVGKTFGYPFAAYDSGGEPLTFDVAGLPPGATVTPTPGAAGDSIDGIFQWTPTAADLGTTHEVHLYVRDVEQRRASLRFKIRAVADGSAVAIDDEPESIVPDRSAERPFAAPARVAAATSQEIACDLYANRGISSLAAEAYQAADAAQALGEAADALIDLAHADSPSADDLAGYHALRAKQAEAALIAADQLYRLYVLEASDAALVAGAHACRAGLYAAMDLAE